MTADTFQDITFDTNQFINGWTHSLGTADFVCDVTAKYFVTIEVGLERAGGGQVAANLRCLLDGVEIPGSHFGMDLTSANNTAFSLSRTFILDAVAGKTLKFEVAASTDTVSVAPTPNPGGSLTTPGAATTIRRL